MAKIKVLHLAKKYQGNSRLRNIMVLGPDPLRFEIRSSFISGMPDGNNLLDKYDKSIYLQIDDADRNKIKTIIRLVKFLRKEKPLILHCHRHRATVFGSIAATIAGVPYVVSHIHGTDRTRNVIRKVTNVLISKKIVRFVGVSNGVREDFIKSNPLIPESKVIAIQNCVDFSLFSSRLSKEEERNRLQKCLIEKFLFGIIARLNYKKNHDLLIDVLDIAVRKRPDIHLLIVGNGPLLHKLELKVEHMKLQDSVTFLGYRTDIPDILRALDAFILPSLSGEGFPLAILEAMGSRLPIIASRIPGIIEMFDGVDAGRLVDPNNVEEMASAMLWIASLSKEERDQLSQNAFLHAREHFNADIMAKKIESLYNSIAGR
jgi:glycosyltransferase involved in cell wall biosynthesis